MRKTKTAPASKLALPPGDARRDTPEGMERHAFVHQELRALVHSMTRDFMRFLVLADEAITEKHYERLGYRDPDEYFEREVGYSYRSLKRRLAILEALRRIDELDERERVQAVLAELGVHKAGVLAPAIGKPNVAWKPLLKQARRLGESDLQAQVTRLLKSKSRGRSGTVKGEERTALGRDVKYLRAILGGLPDDVRAEVDEVFAMARFLFETDSNAAVVIALVQESKVEWENEARARGWKRAGETDEQEAVAG
jgi:hypothetical protein